jgi:hypothetical protein
LPILGEKIGVFLQLQCYDKMFAKIEVVKVKNAIFAKFLGQSIFKIITLVPGHPADALN